MFAIIKKQYNCPMPLSVGSLFVQSQTEVVCLLHSCVGRTIPHSCSDINGKQGELPYLLSAVTIRPLFPAAAMKENSDATNLCVEFDENDINIKRSYFLTVR